MVTWVLLNVAKTCATPTVMFFAPLTLMIFLALGSSASSSAAVGAAGAAGAGAPASASAGLGDGAASPFLAGAFSAAGLAVALSPCGLTSFGGAVFFALVSSVIPNL